jgi:hypothetical protein
MILGPFPSLLPGGTLAMFGDIFNSHDFKAKEGEVFLF